MSPEIHSDRDMFSHPNYARAPGDRKRTYARLFWNPDKRHKPRNCLLHRKLCQFRLGHHGLDINNHANHEARRCMRCHHCSVGVVEDEFHMLLECPMYNDLRQKYNQLFLEAGVALPTTGNQICLAIQGDSSVQALMAVQDQDTLARFIKECLQKRRSLRH